MQTGKLNSSGSSLNSPIQRMTLALQVILVCQVLLVTLIPSCTHIWN